MATITRRDLLCYQQLAYDRPHLDVRSVLRGKTEAKTGSPTRKDALFEKHTELDWRSSGETKRTIPVKDMSVTACLCREAFALLNKLTRENFHAVSEKLSTLDVTTGEQMSLLSDMIFNKAVSEHAYAETYADLCLLLHQSYTVQVNENVRISFAGTILNKCQREFKNLPRWLVGNSPAHRVSESSGSSLETNVTIDDSFVSKKRLTGFMKFIAYLYLRDLLSNKIIREVALHLVFQEEQPNEHFIECFCVLLKNTGATLDSSAVSQDYMNTFLVRLEELRAGETYSSRINFFIEDLVELRRNKWKDTRAMADVQTKMAIRAKKEAEGTVLSTPFHEKIAGERPAYIQQKLEQVAATKSFDERKVNKLVDYACEDQSKEAVISDWRGLECDRRGYTMATMTVIRRGFQFPDKMKHIVSLLTVLGEAGQITTSILKKSLKKLKPELNEVVIDNPKATQFFETISQLRDELKERGDEAYSPSVSPTGDEKMKKHRKTVSTTAELSRGEPSVLEWRNPDLNSAVG